MKYLLSIIALAFSLSVSAYDAPHFPESVIYAIDVSGQPDGPAEQWLYAQGFELKLDADALNPHFQDNRLYLETDDQEAGLFVKKLALPDVTHIRIHWGVERYPPGADWENGVNAVPIAVVVSFGNKKLDSGAFYIPDAPYFIGVFLGEKENQDKAYVGKYYQQGGRYFCVPCGASPGELVVTELDLEKAFEAHFPRTLPTLTSFGFQMNTKNTEGGAVAFLEKVEFLSN